MVTEQPDYISYLLRLWSMSDEEEVVWRASLESPRTGQRKGFASLDDLFDFLRQQTGVSSNSRGGDQQEHTPGHPKAVPK